MAENRPTTNFDLRTLLNEIEENLSAFENQTDEKTAKLYIAALTINLKNLADLPIEILKSSKLEFSSDHFERIRQRCETQYERFPNANWIDFKAELHRLRSLIQIDFDTKPLKFAQDAIEFLDELFRCETSVVKMIEEIRKATGNPRLFHRRGKLLAEGRRTIVIACIGTLKAGKSSFINYLLDAQICPIAIKRSTGRLCKIVYGEKNRIRILSKIIEVENDDDATIQRFLRPIVELDGAERSSAACEDQITIELNREELRNIELWDLPGFDENARLDEMIGKILADADLLFILTPLIDSGRISFINLVKKALKSSKSNIFSDNICFVATKVDLIGNVSISSERESLDSLLDTLRNDINEKIPELKSSERYRLIPMSTNVSNDVKTFAKCREKFFVESTKFFDFAFRRAIDIRFGSTIDIVHQVLDYYNVDRAIEKLEKFEKHLKKSLVEIDAKLNAELQPIFQRIESDVLTQMKTSIARAPLLRTGWFEKEIMKKSEQLYSEQVEKFSGDIQEQINNSCRNILASFYFNAELHAKMQHAFFQITQTNPHSIPIGRLSNIIQWETKDEEQIGLNYIFTYFKEYFYLIFTDKERYIQYIRGEITDDATRTIQKICREKQKDLAKLIHNHLGQLTENIGEQQLKLKDLKKSPGGKEFLKQLQENVIVNCVRETCLTVYDTQCRMTFPVDKIEKNVVNQSLVSVSLFHRNSNEGIRAMTKRMPIESLTINDFQYIRSVKHKNILDIYGLLKGNDKRNVYILMKFWNCDLAKFLQQFTEAKKVHQHVLDEIIKQMIEGLDHLHNLGFVHQNFTATNIFLKVSNGERSPKVRIGTLGFVRKSTGDADDCATLQSDIYSLGEVIKMILKTPCHRYNDELFQFWNKMSDRCQSTSSNQRPFCHVILAERTQLESKSLN